MASTQYAFAMYFEVSVKILLDTPAIFIAFSQYEIAYELLSYCYMKTLFNTPDICMASPQYEFAYVVLS